MALISVIDMFEKNSLLGHKVGDELDVNALIVDGARIENAWAYGKLVHKKNAEFWVNDDQKIEQIKLYINNTNFKSQKVGTFKYLSKKMPLYSFVKFLDKRGYEWAIDKETTSEICLNIKINNNCYAKFNIAQQFFYCLRLTNPRSV